MTDINVIGKRIKELREAKGLSKSDLAAKLGLKSHSTISKWESGDNHPKGREIGVLCKLFNVSADYLLGLVTNDVPQQIHMYKYYPVSVSAGLLESVDCVDQDDTQLITVHDSLLGKYAGSNSIFFVKVSGTSMDKLIPESSTVGIKRVNSIFEIKDNDIVLFSKDNQYSIKRFNNNLDNQQFIFSPESTDSRHRSIIIKHDDISTVEIHGKVVLYGINN